MKLYCDKCKKLIITEADNCIVCLNNQLNKANAKIKELNKEIEELKQEIVEIKDLYDY